jgi:hypothetical protein
VLQKDQNAIALMASKIGAAHDVLVRAAWHYALESGA